MICSCLRTLVRDVAGRLQPIAESSAEPGRVQGLKFGVLGFRAVGSCLWLRLVDKLVQQRFVRPKLTWNTKLAIIPVILEPRSLEKPHPPPLSKQPQLQLEFHQLRLHSTVAWQALELWIEVDEKNYQTLRGLCIGFCKALLHELLNGVCNSCVFPSGLMITVWNCGSRLESEAF